MKHLLSLIRSFVRSCYNCASFLKICTNDRMVSRAVLKLLHQGFHFYLPRGANSHWETQRVAPVLLNDEISCFSLLSLTKEATIPESSCLWLWRLTSPGPSSPPFHQTGLAFACARHLGLQGKCFCMFSAKGSLKEQLQHKLIWASQIC